MKITVISKMDIQFDMDKVTEAKLMTMNEMIENGIIKLEVGELSMVNENGDEFLDDDEKTEMAKCILDRVIGEEA